MTALILSHGTNVELAELLATAAAHPVDMKALIEAMKHRAGKAAHKVQMTRQSITLPIGYMVTFSIETGHPGGTARHMSMSIDKQGRIPNEIAVWMVAERLGFVGDLNDCVTWVEDLEGHGAAVNVVQVIA
jgi:hypothetical protein